MPDPRIDPIGWMAAQVGGGQVAERRARYVTPRPAGRPVPGCASHAVLQVLQQSKSWTTHRSISQATRRSKGAVAWGLHYLQGLGLIQSRQASGVASKRRVFEYRIQQG